MDYYWWFDVNSTINMQCVVFSVLRLLWITFGWRTHIHVHSLTLLWRMQLSFLHHALKYSLRISLRSPSLSLSHSQNNLFSLLEILGHIKINQSTQISRQSVGWTQNNIVGVENDAVFKSVPYFSFLFTFPLSISPPVSQRDNQLKHHNMQHSSLVCSAYGKELSVKISN